MTMTIITAEAATAITIIILHLIMVHAKGMADFLKTVHKEQDGTLQSMTLISMKIITEEDRNRKKMPGK
jgi:hypothetical protein